MIFYSISDDDAFAPAAASRKIEKKRKIESSSSSSSFFFSLSSKPTKVPLTLLLLRTTNKATTFGRESSEALFPLVTNRFLPQKCRVYNPKQERGRKMAREKRKNFQNPREI